MAKNTLAHYKQSLEDLTFNSKPLIDDLTRAAGLCQPMGDQVVELIQSRIMEVARTRDDVLSGLECQRVSRVSYICFILLLFI